MNPLEERLADRIRRHGPVPLSDVVEAALYDPDHGFYSTAGRAGRRGGDFLTSPEIGPLFGLVVARALDAWWDELGRPARYTVVDAGAGTGTLARTVLAARPRCTPALHYVLVERSAALRSHHADHLPTLGEPAPGGPAVASLAELPRPAGPTVIVANELLDNLPFDLVERRGGRWYEVRVDVAAREGGARLIEHLVAMPSGDDAPLDRLVRDAADGARIPVQWAAAEWLRDALDLASPGRVAVFDYGDTSASLARRPWTEWVRTYRGHRHGADPLADLGAQDITVEVAFDQLGAVRHPDRDRAQAEFLAEHGLEELVEAGRRQWAERAHIGDLEAVRGRSRIGEAVALTDPAGIGGFRVLEWIGS
jgi:SAM-dependent MidA family methyltransferase